MPRLIIEHNIYGVDIDPRATQIASLSLWLRAQRAWHEAGVKATDRPQIGRGHVVAAVLPPAEVWLRERFMADLNVLDAALFEQTLFLLKDLPELGVLLQVEREVPSLIRKIFGEHGDLFKAVDMTRWEKAKTRLRAALLDFARTAQSTYQGRLFAQDALEGLRLIELVDNKFDVVLMNPPFGALTPNTKTGLSKHYPNSQNDLLSLFIERGLQCLKENGRLGSITSRTCFFLPSFQDWRSNVLNKEATLEVLADLGLGVMDDAFVEAAAYTMVRC